MPFGLVSSETIDDYWSQNVRRKIFYAYPNGTAPLTGLLSLTTSEDTPYPTFGWQEERWMEIRTQTVQGPNPSGSKTGPFAIAGTTGPSGDTNGKFSLNQWDTVRIYVQDASQFGIDASVKLFGLGTDATGPVATASTDVAGRITSTDTTPNANYIEISVTLAYANLLNVAATSNSLYLILMGSAYAEGSRSRSGTIVFPSEIFNNTQIFKTPFEMTRTALKEPTKYDKTGAYKDMAKTNGINHLAGLERTLFFGERAKTTAVDPETGSTVSRRFAGGLRWFLDQWEQGTMYGQQDVSGQTDYVQYTNKRVIKLAGKTINKTTFNLLMARLFERTNNTSWDKLCLCGPEYLAKIADVFERQIQYTSMRDEGFDGFNFEMVKHQSNSGTVYYKQHPLFTSPEMRNSAFYVDLGYLGYRPLSDTDTDIQPMIQLPDADKRKDQWLTECGFEIRFPEANMYVENLGGVTL